MPIKYWWNKVQTSIVDFPLWEKILQLYIKWQRFWNKDMSYAGDTIHFFEKWNAVRFIHNKRATKCIQY